MKRAKSEKWSSEGEGGASFDVGVVMVLVGEVVDASTRKQLPRELPAAGRRQPHFRSCSNSWLQEHFLLSYANKARTTHASHTTN